jgi:hypothetical protein
VSFRFVRNSGGDETVMGGVEGELKGVALGRLRDASRKKRAELWVESDEVFVGTLE